MDTIAQILLSLGLILLVGLLTDLIGKRTFLPRVTLLIMLGIFAGRDGLDIIPDSITRQMDLISELALLMVGFLLGGKLVKQTFVKSGRKIIWISVSTVLITTIIVFCGLMIIGVPMEIAILLGCIASATAPAATVDTVLESGYKGEFANSLLSIVAIDDLWALIIFSFGVAVVSVFNGMGDTASPIFMAFRDIGGAFVLGLGIGLPAAYITGRVRPGQPMLTEALGLVLLCGGLAMWMEVSFLIASMVMGAVITNLAKHHEYPFHEIENIEWPFMVVFFFIAGATLELNAIKEVSIIVLVYIICRFGGKYWGANIGSRCCKEDVATRRWMGLALLPQAGAAIGMTLLAAHRFPEYQHVLLTVVISSTIFFEIIGPVLTRYALRHAQKQDLSSTRR